MSKKKPDIIDIVSSVSTFTGVLISIMVSIITVTFFAGNLKAENNITRIMAEDTRDKNRALYATVMSQYNNVLSEIRSLREALLVEQTTNKVKEELKNGSR